MSVMTDITERTLLDDLTAAIHERHATGLRLRDASLALQLAQQAVNQADDRVRAAQRAVIDACTPEEYRDDWKQGI